MKKKKARIGLKAEWRGASEWRWRRVGWTGFGGSLARAHGDTPFSRGIDKTPVQVARTAGATRRAGSPKGGKSVKLLELWPRQIDGARRALANANQR